MKRRVLALTILLILAFTMSAQAIELRAISAKPRLTFDGTTALCSATCKGAGSSDKIDVTLTLYQGSTYVDSWNNSGTGRVYLSKECQVKSGKEYKLELVYSVNGTEMPSVCVTNRCP